MKALRKMHWRKNCDHQEGFTLVELLVVIVILGILAAIVVFAVTGVTGNGQKSACQTDARTVEAAEEAAFAQSQSTGTASYTNMAGLTSGGFLHQSSTLWSISLTSNSAGVNTAYSLTNATTACSGVTP